MIDLVVKVLLGTSLLIVARCIYRLTLHPLAGIPGPKLAAMTSAYAMSWDFPKESSYIKNFPKWHAQYGPIIRIEPNHIHVLDIDAYNTVFKIGTKFYRDPAVYSFPFTRGGFFNKLHVKDAKLHRDLYMPYFSRANVQNLEPTIRRTLGQLLTQIDQAAGKTIDMKRAARSWTADTVMRYMYDKDFGAVAYPDFKIPMLECMDDYFKNMPFGWYFPSIVSTIVDLVAKLPRSRVPDEGIAASLAILDGSESHIAALKAQPRSERQISIFESAMAPNSEKGHPILTVKDLAADALTFFTAGTDTTANVIDRAIWGLLNDRAALATLTAELRAAIPHGSDLTATPQGWAALEALPYLRCVVKESLRLSYGVPGKIPRIVPAEGATLLGHSLPGGTAISMSCHTYHHHAPYFGDDADEFKPERWADAAKAAELEKYLVTFSRGSRNCIGQNLAYAELYYVLGYLFRRFELSLAEDFPKEEMEWEDCFVVVTRGHLRIRARRAET
ncbi:Trichodiene oxygenase [Cyphellophora attinorum]|uniref:Trichodiene oxygenase n=1 Tax=Cyphellophora attinorum TaxID=1664694 RepID=A0A0N1NYG8_9EURO|nr:Trichodiene oxygenase [Phialophora attinorum]KPI36683.1 Trichodiene oxygenase [Phialophora attinorum]